MQPHSLAGGRVARGRGILETIWGAPGLLLSTPLTVCLVVLGRHVPKLQFLDILLGSESVLPPEVKLYQRLLADDFEEAARVSDQYLQEHAVRELYDKVLIPALAFADQDRMRGALDRAGWTAVAKSIGDIVDDVRAETPSSDAESRHGAVRRGGRSRLARRARRLPNPSSRSSRRL